MKKEDKNKSEDELDARRERIRERVYNELDLEGLEESEIDDVIDDVSDDEIVNTDEQQYLVI